MTMYEVTYTVDEEKGIYSAFMLEAEDIETARAYAESLKENVIGVCIAPTRPKPGQSVLTVPAGWTPEEEKEEEEPEDARAEESADTRTPLEKHVDFYIDFINSAAFDPYEAINNDDLTEYDIEFTIDYQFDFIGARVMIAGGGPNIYIDTIKGAVVGYWGLETVEKYYSETAADLLTDYYREIYYSLKS